MTKIGVSLLWLLFTWLIGHTCACLSMDKIGGQDRYIWLSQGKYAHTVIHTVIHTVLDSLLQVSPRLGSADLSTPRSDRIADIWDFRYKQNESATWLQGESYDCRKANLNHAQPLYKHSFVKSTVFLSQIARVLAAYSLFCNTNCCMHRCTWSTHEIPLTCHGCDSASRGGRRALSLSIACAECLDEWINRGTTHCPILSFSTSTTILNKARDGLTTQAS